MVTMQRYETCCVELTKQTPNEKERQITAAIYARVSSHNQIFGYSLEEQIRRIQKALLDGEEDDRQ